MSIGESPSEEQKKYVAAVCPEYHSHTSILGNNIVDGDLVSCDGCIHWDNGRCVIFDDVLTGIDQT